MSQRIGIYICKCAGNIAETIDLEQLAREATGLADVAVVRSHDLLCGDEGCALVADDIRTSRLDRVVVAACSPREHEKTFRAACARGGINPFMLQMANIRELAAWVTPDRAEATLKALCYVAAAVRRVGAHAPIESKEIDCVPDALVIGAGAAGIEAALVLAQKGRHVFVVERQPHIGGSMLMCDEIFPGLECSSCLLEPKMDRLLHDERIQVLTHSDVESVLGYFGNFVVRVRRRARYVRPESCLGCPVCFAACPVEAPNAFDQGLSRRKAIYLAYPGALPNVPVIDREICAHFSAAGCTACSDACLLKAIDFDDQDRIVELTVGSIVVASGFEPGDPGALPRLMHGRLPEVYTSLELERLLSSNGPSAGKLVNKDGNAAHSVAILLCADRSAPGLGYCSGICCINSLKLAHVIATRMPGVEVTLVHGDWCLPGQRFQQFKDDVAALGVHFVKVADPATAAVVERGGRPAIKAAYTIGAERVVAADMVVLAIGMRSRPDAAQLASMLGIALDEHGFVRADHSRMAPVSTALGGVYVAGTATGPADIQASTTSGAAAAGKILSVLVPGEKLKLEPTAAEIDPALCCGCKTCLRVCPYTAIAFLADERVSAVNEALCRGCGACAAACPSGAAHSRHFTDRQLFAEIEGLLR